MMGIAGKGRTRREVSRVESPSPVAGVADDATSWGPCTVSLHQRVLALLVLVRCPAPDTLPWHRSDIPLPNGDPPTAQPRDGNDTSLLSPIRTLPPSPRQPWHNSLPSVRSQKEFLRCSSQFPLPSSSRRCSRIPTRIPLSRWRMERVSWEPWTKGPGSERAPFATYFPLSHYGSSQG